MSQFKIGDHVRVTKCEVSCGDYDVGDTAVVTRHADDGTTPGVIVRWDKPRYADEREECRQVYLYDRELERVEPAVDPVENQWAIAYGDVVNGFTFVGPFGNYDDALAYVEPGIGDAWSIIELDQPMTSGT